MISYVNCLFDPISFKKTDKICCASSNGQSYVSISEASRVLDIGKHIIMNRVKKYGPHLLYINGEWSNDAQS